MSRESDPQEQQRHARLLERRLLRETERALILETSSRRYAAVAARVRAELEAELEARGHFLAVMSHELRTPIHGVLGVLELLKATNPTPEQAELVATAQDASTSLLAIINDILDFSKFESGNLSLELVSFDPTEVLDRVAGTAGARATVGGLRLYLEPGESLPQSILGDPVRFRQIADNLLANAIKFTPRGGEVSMRSGWEAGRLWLEVADTGIGIAEEKLDLIFEPYTQADRSTTRHFGGTGLGLAICRSLARTMGGDVAVTSTLGLGSMFRVEVSMPVVEPATAKPLGAEAAVALSDPREQAIAERALRQLGVRTRPWVPGLSIPVVSDAVLEPHGRAEQLWLVVDAGATTGEPHGQVLVRPLRRSSLRRIVEGALQRAPLASSLGRRVLVADDNPLNQRLVQRLLRRLGCHLESVSTGLDALTAASKTSWDLILMAVQMPKMSGLEATRQIRRLPPPFGQTRIVGLTAAAFPEEIAHCIQAGMDSVLAKPFKLEDLEAVVRG